MIMIATMTRSLIAQSTPSNQSAENSFSDDINVTSLPNPLIFNHSGM